MELCAPSSFILDWRSKAIESLHSSNGSGSRGSSTSTCLRDLLIRNQEVAGVTFTLILLALFAPYMVFYQRWSDSAGYLVSAVTWSFINQSGGTALILPHLVSILFFFLVASPRLFFVLVISRSLREKSKPGEFFLASALIVFQLLVLWVYYYFNPFYIELLGGGGPLIFRPAPPVGSLVCVPAPILLCVGLFVLGLWKTKWTILESES